MITPSFKPTWYLKNPHVQTIWPTITRRSDKINLYHERVELPDHDFIDLAWDQENMKDAHKPIIIIMHGLGGSINSTYSRGLMRAISNASLRPVFMHLRGASFEPNRLDRGYHSGETEDLALITQHLQQHNAPIGAIGVSLSGNMLLKWLGQTNLQNPLFAAVAISVPFELHHSVDFMNKGFSRIYQFWLLNSLRFYLLRKYKNKEAPFDLQQAKTAKTFWDFDNIVTAPIHGFIDAADYYQQCSSRQYLKNIAKPTLIIHSKDDPFVPEHSIPNSTELSDTTTLVLTEHGGHVGFIGGTKPSHQSYWLETIVPQFFTQQVCQEAGVTILDINTARTR